MNGKVCLNVICVIPKNSTIYPQSLALAQKCCKEHGFNVDRITEEDCMKLQPCRKDIFILAEFDGPLFEFLKSCNSKVVGPQCMLAFINNEEPLPDVSMSVFNFAMKGIVVTSTGLSSQEKKTIQEKIQFMGGNYSPEFSANITHLIVKSVADFSPKFKVAVGRRIPRMIPDWIDAVWDANLEETIHATDPIFTRLHCPIFHGCIVSASQISVEERESIKKIIRANGGQYSAKLERGKTNIVIIPSAEGEKYRHARQWKILCLKPEWIQASLEEGYAVDPKCFTLNETNTTLPSNKSSTLKAHSRSFANLGNSSVNSTIFDENQQTCQPIDETAIGYPCSFSKPQRYGSLQREPLDCLNLTLSVNAGPFLKGCKIFLSGFNSPQLEKLRRILSNAGVTRSFVVNKSISHVIVGETVKVDWDQLMRLENKPHVVTVEWLAQSLRLKSAAPEADYLHPEWEDLSNFCDTKGASKDHPPIEKIDDSLEEMQLTLQTLITDQIEEEEAEKSLPTEAVLSDLTLKSDSLETYSVSSMNGLIASSKRSPVVTKNHLCIVTESMFGESANCDTPSYLHPSRNGTNTLCITPEPRPALCNMLTPDTPYGRLLNPDPSPGTRKMWKHALDNRVRLTPRADESVDVSTSPHVFHPIEIFPGITEYFHNLTKRMLRDCLSAGDAADNTASTDLSKTQKTVASQSVASAYCVMFSGMSQEDRDSCTEILENLGGTVISANQYDPACTHLVVAKLGCNEKLLTSMAAGKWIVHPGWVYESEKMRRFVDERKYEWGNPTCNDSISKEEAKIAAAAYYWRVNRNRDFPAGPFQGITAELHLGDENDSFQRLLEAGGGEVVSPGSIFCFRSALDNSKTNLCIVENREMKKRQLSLYASKGLYCVPPVYLRNLILAVGNKLQWSESVLPVFLPYLSMASGRRSSRYK
ncbi:DNA topoisomerase 2-binding protein 1 isoform X3 [Daphnia magna]|uniref:DNA topoisomerase 2-binding protein 1 isoform X3 n=1 Tax=Daphnia magna TaxID=35525 RepID=UPI001E1BB1BE|nr:DNA topoisomerase 2-binding protein 1 isoform X3 [Daphnia magna]